jgi:hypothetical protein
MAFPPSSQDDKSHDPRNPRTDEVESMIEQIPQEIRKLLSAEDVQALQQTEGLGEYIDLLQQIYERIMSGESKQRKFEKILHQFFSGRTSREKKALTDTMRKLKYSMSEEMLEVGKLKPLDTPAVREAQQGKKER